MLRKERYYVQVDSLTAYCWSWSTDPPAVSRYPTLYENSGDVTLMSFLHAPLRMRKMPISGREALALLNGLQRGERRNTVHVRRAAILGLVILGLGIVIPLIP